MPCCLRPCGRRLATWWSSPRQTLRTWLAFSAASSGRPARTSPTPTRRGPRTSTRPCSARRCSAPCRWSCLPLPPDAASRWAFCFSLHADTAVHGHDRQGLERLVRYGARGPVAESRLRALEDGRYEYTPKKGQPFTLTAEALVKRLVALVPPPNLHLTSFHGVFAPHAALRLKVTGAPPATPVPSPRKKTKKRRTRRLDWAALHQHTFGVDVLRCPCGGRRRIHAIHSTRKAAEERLVQLGHHLAPSAILPPDTAQPVLLLAGCTSDVSSPLRPARLRTRPSRAPLSPSFSIIHRRSRAPSTGHCARNSTSASCPSAWFHGLFLFSFRDETVDGTRSTRLDDTPRMEASTTTCARLETALRGRTCRGRTLRHRVTSVLCRSAS